MKRILSFILFSGFIHIYSQICNSPRFTEVQVYPPSDIFIDSNVVYGQAINWLGANETLTLNMAFPKLSVDTMQKRPLVFLVHGGGFVGGDKNDLNAEAFLFARRGFVAVTIDYRLGRDCSGPDTLSYDKAVYRAVQDAHAALRFMVSKSDSIGIDTNWIFVGGGSAGAGTCLALVYASQSEFNSVFPSFQSSLGNLNTSTNSLTNTFTLKGIFNNWGAVGRDFFQSTEALPTINFHGDADPTVDVDSGYAASCVNPLYTYGSNMIHQRLVGWGICSQTIIKPGGDHGIYNSNIASIDFRVAKASCFFKSVMCGTCYSDYTTDSIPATCSTTMSISTENANNNYLVYPNPVESSLYVSSPNTMNQLSYSIYDLSGKVQMTGVTNHDLKVEQLRPGIYILFIGGGEQPTYIKFIKN